MSTDNKYIIYINGTAVEVSKEIHDFLIKSDRQIKYAEQDRKQERITIDSENERVSVKPSMEDSLDRLTELGVEFPDQQEDLYESVIRKVMLEQAMSKLDDEERYLIAQLFYFDRTERDIALELNQTQQNINKMKRKILCKLYKMLK
ncbi:MAG: hypothetical protein ACI4WS_08010 [Oscillospiraceae bacterium]